MTEHEIKHYRMVYRMALHDAAILVGLVFVPALAVTLLWSRIVAAILGAVGLVAWMVIASLLFRFLRACMPPPVKP
jgi:hypothetical protein